MLKKLCLSTAFAIFSFASISASVDRITAIKDRIEHITKAQEAIDMQFEHLDFMSKKSLNSIQNKFGINYESLIEKIFAVLDPVFESEGLEEELNSFIDKITDIEVSRIVNQGLHFTDITYDSITYDSIKQKLSNRLKKAFPEWNEAIEQIFNIFYVMCVSLEATEVLDEKLEDKKNELLAELEALEATNEISCY